MINAPVLVLNQDYQPLNICQVRRAIVLLLCGKAEVLENGRGDLHSINNTFDVPSVIRLISFIRRPYRQRKMTKLEIFNRDRYICQYCGKESNQLTLDHVIPKRRSGEHSWGNVVSACVPCNRRKAGYTPSEAKMHLLRQPQPPSNDGFYVPYNYLYRHTEWGKYLRQ